MIRTVGLTSFTKCALNNRVALMFDILHCSLVCSEQVCLCALPIQLLSLLSPLLNHRTLFAIQF